MPRQPATHVDDPKKLGIRLRSAREKAGMSQRDLSFSGCTPAYISRIEAGARVPSLQMINELSGRLGVTSQWLATGVEPLGFDDSEIVDAEVAARLGDLDEARRLFQAHLRRGDPAYAAALAGMGRIAFREERVDEAIDYLEQALESRGRQLMADPGAVDALGRAYAAAGALENAMALFADAVEAARLAEAPVEELRFAVMLANALIDRAMFAEAETTLARVIQLTKQMNDPLAQVRLFWSQSRLHVLRGQTQLAARYARRALDILERTENDAAIAMAYHLLAFAEVEAGNGEEALGYIETGRAYFAGEMTERDVAKFSLEEARALLLLGRKRPAAKVAASTLQLIDFVDPQDRGRSFVALGDVFASVGEQETARDLYEKAFDLLAEQGRPYIVTAARRLADLLEEEGDAKGALVVLKRATQISEASLTVQR